MKLISNAKYGEPIENGTVFNIKGYGFNICIHKIIGCGDTHLHGFGTSFAESGGFYVRSGDAPRVPACAAGAAAAVRPGNFQKTCQGRRFCGEIEN